MKKLMLLLSVLLLSVLSVAQETSAEIDAEIAKLNKALLDSPNAKLEEQTLDINVRNQAIELMQKAAPVMTEYRKIQSDIAIKETQVKKIMSNIGSGDKDRYGQTKGEKQAQPTRDEIAQLKNKLQTENYKLENFKSEFQSLKRKYNDSLNAKIADLKVKKQNLNSAAVASISLPVKAPEAPKTQTSQTSPDPFK